MELSYSLFGYEDGNMQIIKILNNSIVLVLNDIGQEVILMGKGIGYNKSVGYQLNENDIEKVFILEEKDISKNITQLTSEIDNVYFELAEQVITYAVENYNMELIKHIYLGLTDHLFFAVKRIRDGIEIQNFYTENLKIFNPDEFQVGLYACCLIKEKMNIEFPIDEASSIAFHFINAQQNNPYSTKNKKISEVVKGILDIVKYTFIIKYDEESIAYIRFISHVRRFAQRVINSRQESEDTNDILFDNIFDTCYREYDCVKKIRIFVKEKYHTDISRQEELYLTIHIHRILEEYSLKK